MAAEKLLGRIEQAEWQPPVLSFVIERHGGTVHGSTRADPFTKHFPYLFREQPF